MNVTPTFLYPIFGLETTTTCPGCGLGTNLRLHNFVVVPRFTTRVTGAFTLTGATVLSFNHSKLCFCFTSSTVYNILWDLTNVGPVVDLKPFDTLIIFLIIQKKSADDNK